MKLFTKAALSTVLLLASTNVFASVCGTGYITEVIEGNENGNDLLIKIQYTTDTRPDQDHNGYLSFSESLGVERMRGIRAIAYLALANGNQVEISQDSGTCAAATQIKLYRMQQRRS